MSEFPLPPSQPPTSAEASPAPEKPGGSARVRRLLPLAAVAAVLALAVTAYLLLFQGGGGEPASAAGPVSAAAPAPVVTPAAPTPPALQPADAPDVVDRVTGRDPFEPQYVAPTAAPTAPNGAEPAPAPAGADAATPAEGAPAGATGTSPGKDVIPTWIELQSQSETRATFRVGYSSGSARLFSDVAAPAAGEPLTPFGEYFSLLSLRSGQATVRYGDSAPFTLRPGSAGRHQLTGS